MKNEIKGKTSPKTNLEKVSSYTSTIQGIILTLGALVTIIISIGGANFKTTLGEDFSYTRSFIIVFTVLLSMLIAYVIAWIYRSPSGVLKKIVDIDKNSIYTFIASLGTGLFMFLYATNWRSNSNWESLLSSSLVIGAFGGVLLGIFLLVAMKFFLERILGWISKVVKPLGRWGKAVFMIMIASLIAATINNEQIISAIDFDAIGRIPVLGYISEFTHYAEYIVGFGIFLIALGGLYVLAGLANASYEQRQKFISDSQK